MHILFSEQHVMVRDGLAPFLLEVDEGAAITFAGTTDEVFRVIDNSPSIDLAILDHAMLGNGLESCIASLVQRHPTARPVVLSPRSDSLNITQAMAAGAVGYIPKRLSARALVSALRLVMVGERYIPASMLQAGPAPASKTPDRAGDGGREGVGTLTSREAEILNLLRQGLPNKLIARRLNVSEVTVKSHLCHVFRKLGVSNRVQAAQYANAAE